MLSINKASGIYPHEAGISVARVAVRIILRGG